MMNCLFNKRGEGEGQNEIIEGKYTGVCSAVHFVPNGIKIGREIKALFYTPCSKH